MYINNDTIAKVLYSEEQEQGPLPEKTTLSLLELSRLLYKTNNRAEIKEIICEAY